MMKNRIAQIIPTRNQKTTRIKLMRIKTTTIFAAAMAAATLTTAHAMTNDRDWPSVVVSPILDVPMRDTAIMRGPDGTYYLTGTLQGIGPSGAADFDNGRQIKLWQSQDLKSWKELGVAYDLEKPAGDYQTHRWMTMQSHKDPSRADSPICWGFKAPELHHIRGDWYICFSINDQGTGLLKSSSGKPEGPYLPHAQITVRYGDASMFWDEKDEFGGDGAVYWLFGGGWIAKMNADLTALAEKPRLLQPEPQTQAEWTGKTRLDFPLQVGDRGAFLFKNRGRYYLTAAERTNRMNASCDDTFVAMAKGVYGPYDQRTLMVPHGGGITVFRGPRSSAVPKYYYPQQAYFLSSVSKLALPKEEVDKAKDDDTLYATFFGNDVRAIFRDRPAFLPLEWNGPERFNVYFGFHDFESHPLKPLCVFTERGPWPWMKPLLPGERHRDIKVTPAPDGNYYFSGSSYNHPGKLMVWKSKDLATWEKIGPLWTYEQIEWLPEKLPYPKDCYPHDPNSIHPDWEHVFWHTWVTWWKDTFYITACIFKPKDPKQAHLNGTGAWKSTTGKIEGPYVSLGRVGGQVGDPGPNLFSFFEWRDQLYVWDWKNWKNVVAEANLDTPGWKFDWKLVDKETHIYEWMQRADCSFVSVVDDVPLFSFGSSGMLDGGESWVVYTYDVNYLPMETPWGPVIKGAQSRCIPYVHAANRFKDHQGRWWSSYFGDGSGPWAEKFGLVPLRVEKRGGGDIFIDVEDNPSDEIKRIIGGGKIAEVKTVQETLK
jgi:hypothetical protein